MNDKALTKATNSDRIKGAVALFESNEFKFNTSAHCLEKLCDILSDTRQEIEWAPDHQTLCPRNTNDLMNKLADVVILAHQYANKHGIDFDDVVSRRIDNNIERFTRACDVQEIAGCSIFEAWNVTKRKEGE